MEPIQKLIKNNDTEFMKLVRYYKYADMYPDHPQEVSKKEIEQKFLDKYEIMLENTGFLFGDKSTADIALLPCVRQFAFVDKEWFYNSKYKNIIKWLNSFIESSDFKNLVMKKHKPWTNEQDRIYLLDT